MSRWRTVAVGLALALAMTSAGCTGVSGILGASTLEFAAEDATAGTSALDATGYSEYRDRTINETQTFSVADQNRTVEISNEVHAYNRTGTLEPVGELELGRLVVYSTPAIEVAGHTLNPLGGLSNRDIARRFAGAGSGTGLEFEANRSVRALGSERTVSKFGTVSRTSGEDVDTAVHVVSFRHGSDFVVAVAVHPDRGGDEQRRVDRLLRSLRHRTAN